MPALCHSFPTLLLLPILACALGGCAIVSRPALPLPPPVTAAAAPDVAAPPLRDQAADEPVAVSESASVAPAPAPPVEEIPGAAVKPAPDPESSVIAPADEDAFGIASYYAKRFEGRRTASGSIYDPRKLTAAHQSLPFGTRVRVVNLRNGREVVVTVTDRCRKRTFPFIDLSRAAAKELGFFGKGITRVQITVLEDVSSPTAGAGG